jgi:hypothetical protein
MTRREVQDKPPGQLSVRECSLSSYKQFEVTLGPAPVGGSERFVVLPHPAAKTAAAVIATMPMIRFLNQPET